MRAAAAITGIGETEYSKNSRMSDKALQLQAITRAVADAGLQPHDVDGFIPSSIGPGLTAEDFVDNMGTPDLRFSVTLHIGGASGIAGIQDAAMAVASGVATHVVVVSGRNGSSMHRISHAQAARGIQAPHRQHMVSMEFEGIYGANVPMQFYALIAQRHMHLYGTTSEHLGAVAVTMRRHAGMNEKAIMRAPITIDDHQASRMITTPFHLFDCCIETDGATAVVVSSAERATDAKHAPARILGIAEGHPDSPSSTATRVDHSRVGIAKAAPRAFAMAGLTPQDLNLAMFYDPFTFIPIYTLENLGIVGPGEGGPFVAEGNIGLGGKLPVNTHGGLHSQAHSQSGLNHVAEAVKQLRGTAGQAQVADPDPCVVTGMGDFGNGGVMLLSAR